MKGSAVRIRASAFTAFAGILSILATPRRGLRVQTGTSFLTGPRSVKGSLSVLLCPICRQAFWRSLVDAMRLIGVARHRLHHALTSLVTVFYDVARGRSADVPPRGVDQVAPVPVRHESRREHRSIRWFKNRYAKDRLTVATVPDPELRHEGLHHGLQDCELLKG